MIPRLKAALGRAELGAALTPPSQDDVAAFERAFALEMGQRHAVAFPYGRTALMLALEALGLTNREIICPAYTCVVVAHAIVASGNTPVFVDSRDDDFLMDLDLALEAVTPQTGAVIATSLFGQPVDLDHLARFEERHPHVHVIQDCAHSFAASWQGRPVNVAGRAAIFGLNVSKMITSIFGGMLTTDDERLAAAVRRLRDERITPASWTKSLRRFAYLAATYPAFWGPIHSLVNRLEHSGLLDRFVKYYDESIIDMPPDYLTAMTAVEARVGRAQVAKYRNIVEHRRAVADQYTRRLAETDGLRIPTATAGATYSHYVVRTEDADFYLREALRRGVQLGTLIEYNVPDMLAYRGYRFHDRGVARKFAGHVLNLPVHKSIDQRAIDRVVAIMRSRPPAKTLTQIPTPPISLLRCPDCHGALNDEGYGVLTCREHGRFPLVEGIPTFASVGNAAFEKHWRDNRSDELPESKRQVARDFLAPFRAAADASRDPLRVLDAGCGDGVHLAVLAEDAARRVKGTGIDISLPALHLAQSRGDSKWRPIQGDVGTLPFADGTFDAAFSFGVLAYTEDPRRSFDELCRVVRDDGLVGVWFFPRKSGPAGWAFAATRFVCRHLGTFLTARIADLLVPLLPLLPTRSKISLANATWRQCREVVLVNIAPPALYFPETAEVEQMFAANGFDITWRDDDHPITLWGQKRRPAAKRGAAA